MNANVKLRISNIKAREGPASAFVFQCWNETIHT